MSVRILSFHSVIKKACQKWHILFLDIFQQNLAHQEINGREPILSQICITANEQENVISHYKTFYFGKTCAET
jgi:hypothetical protein